MQLFAEWAIYQILLNTWICMTTSKDERNFLANDGLSAEYWPHGWILSLLYRLSTSGEYTGEYAQFTYQIFAIDYDSQDEHFYWQATV
jgi:hypothetical protein